MNRKSQHWLLVATSSLILGSFGALGEKFVWEVIDNFLPEVNKVSSINELGTKDPMKEETNLKLNLNEPDKYNKIKISVHKN